MTQDNHHTSRRTALRTVAGAALVGVAGCLDNSSSSETPDDGTANSASPEPLKRIAVDGTTLVVEFAAEADVDQVNLIQPNGELFGQRDLAAGAQQLSFEIGTAYEPGEYRVIALEGEETVIEGTEEISPQVEIREIGLYRNNPDKPWDDVYGENQTDRKKNGEVFVTVENTGSGPDAAVKLQFTGDVPNPIEEPRDGGLYETERVVIPPDETIDLFSSSFPFGTETADGIGCSPDGNNGQFTAVVETQVSGDQVSKTYEVQYSGSNDMTDCEVTITES